MPTPLQVPPRPSRVTPWLLFALLWGLSSALLVVGSQVVAVLGG